MEDVNGMKIVNAGRNGGEGEVRESSARTCGKLLGSGEEGHVMSDMALCTRGRSSIKISREITPRLIRKAVGACDWSATPWTIGKAWVEDSARRSCSSCGPSRLWRAGPVGDLWALFRSAGVASSGDMGQLVREEKHPRSWGTLSCQGKRLDRALIDGRIHFRHAPD